MKTLRPGDVARAAEALAALAAASLALRLLPFRHVARWLGVVRPGKGAPEGIAPEKIAAVSPVAAGPRVAAVVLAVERAGRRAWWHPTCLPRAMAGRFMLARRGIASTVLFGVTRGTPGGKPIRAHAWLEVDGVAVLGGREAVHFRPIARFDRASDASSDASSGRPSRTPASAP